MRRLATNIKQLRGTFRQSRAPKRTAGERLMRTPPVPRGLPPPVATEWRRLAPVLVSLGVLCEADLRALQLLCETLTHERELREVLAKEGHFITGAGGIVKQHPAVRMLATTRGQAARMLAEFGLTPRARQSIDIPPPPKPGRLASLHLP